MKRSLLSTAVILALGASLNPQGNTAGLTGAWTGEYIFQQVSPSGGAIGTPSDYPQAWTWDFDAGTVDIVNDTTHFGSVWTAHDVTFADQGTYYGTDSSAHSGGTVNMLWDWSADTNIPITIGWDVTASGNAVSDTAIVSVVFSTITAGSGTFPGGTLLFSGSLHKVANVVPVPAAAWLMGSGLIGLIGLARRRKAHV